VFDKMPEGKQVPLLTVIGLSLYLLLGR